MSEASAIYAGWVHHRRRQPREHAFRYRVSLLYLDLEELPHLFRGRWLWSVEGRNVASFRRRDYLGDPAQPLADAVRQRVREELGEAPDGPVRMLTNLRYWGLVFNPVSFYYLFEADGERLHSIVAEITNTPWDERHSYVLRCDPEAPTDSEQSWDFAKRFHVSPFFPMDVHYRWRFRAPAEQLQVDMRNERGEEHLFDAGLQLERRPLNGKSLAIFLLRHPWMSGKVALGIYWQALRLWCKGIPFHPHPRRLASKKSHG